MSRTINIVLGILPVTLGSYNIFGVSSGPFITHQQMYKTKYINENIDKLRVPYLPLSNPRSLESANSLSLSTRGRRKEEHKIQRRLNKLKLRAVQHEVTKDKSNT